MRWSDRRIEGAAAWAAYGAVEAVFTIYARRLLFAPSFVPADGCTLLLLVVYPLIGALLGRFAIPALAVLFAANAVVLMDGRMVALAIGVAALVVLLRTSMWTSAWLLIFPAWMAHQLAQRESLAIKIAAAAAALVAIGVVAMLRRKHGRPVPPQATFATFAVLMLASLFVELPPPRDLPPDASPPRTHQPNILLVLMDTVRADHLSAYGYGRDTTPSLRRFAPTATLYRRAYAPSNMTLSSTASLITGLFPSEHTAHFDDGVWSLGRPLPPAALTVAELLSARGYATGLISANHVYLGGRFGLDQGFQHHDARPPALPFSVPADVTLRRAAATLAEPLLPARFRLRSRRAAEITGLARRYLSRAAGKRRPFFLAVNYMDAHQPSLPPPPYDTRFPGRDASQGAGLSDRLMGTMLREEALAITPREHAHLLSQYDGGIAYEDAEIGRLLDELRARKLYDDTLIVIVADHGDAFGEHGGVGHGMTNYEDQLRVPFLVKRPGQKVGSVVEQPVSVLEAWPILTGAAHAPYPVIAESFPMRGPALAQKYRHPGRAKIEGTLKTIVNVGAPLELYDLAADPAELRNLGRNPTSARMADELGAWSASLSKQPPLPPRELDPETIRRLRSLGYIH